MSVLKEPSIRTFSGRGSKQFLILQPSYHKQGQPVADKSTTKIRHHKTFEKLREFNTATYYKFDLVEYDSIHKIVPLLAEMPEWMPLLGMPSEGAFEAMKDPDNTLRRIKKGEDPMIVEPIDDKGCFEIDGLMLKGFDPLCPEPVLKEFCRQIGLDCDVTWQLSSSQRPVGEEVRVHLFFEYDKEYPLSEREIHASMFGFDTSIYNGVNPVYVAPPIFRESVDGEDMPDPIPQRIGFIKGEHHKAVLPDLGEMEHKLKHIGKKIELSHKTNSKRITYTSKSKAVEDIRSGKNYHNAMLFISASMANKHQTKDKIRIDLVAEMNKVPEPLRCARWYERLEDSHIDRLIDGAFELIKERPRHRHSVKYGGFTRMSEVDPQSYKWDVRQWIAKHRANILAGDRGDGKSSLCAYLAAGYSKGAEWFDTTTKFPEINVGWLSAEEQGDTEIYSRLKVNDARMENIFIMDAKVQIGNVVDYYDILRDKEEIISKIRTHRIGVLFVDTGMSFAGDMDSNKSGDMRKLFLAYNDIAETARCTVITIVHLNKSGTGRMLDDIQGSAQISAAVRVALGLCRDRVTNETYLSVIKANQAEIDQTQKFRFLYDSVEHDEGTRYAKLVPLAWDHRSADDVRNANIKHAKDKSKQKRVISDEEAENLILIMLAQSKTPQGFAKLKEDITEFCTERNRNYPGKNRLEDARSALVGDGLITKGSKARKTVYVITDDGLLRVQQIKSSGIFKE